MADKNTLLALIETNLPDNNEQLITPAKHREVEQQITSSNANLDELTEQEFSGPVNFVGEVKKDGAGLLIDAPSDGKKYVRLNGSWVTLGAFIATSNSTISINTDSAAPSFLSIDDFISPSGITLIDGATGTVQNDTGRVITEMTGSISFNPSVSGGTLRRVVIVSEVSNDGGTTWVGNLNSIRKVEIGSSTESFKTSVSLVLNWPSGSRLRFRAYNELSGTLDFVTEAETILGQSFTGPSMVWDLSEK